MKKLFGIAAALLLALVVALLVVQRTSDGPIGPIPGGPLRAGTLISDPDVDWAAATQDSFREGIGLVELAFLEPPGSRTTVAILHEDQLYIPCDLGFFWRRLRRPSARWFRAALYAFRTWHEHAMRDGRAVVRVEGKRYPRQAMRVTDPDVLAALRAIVERAGGPASPRLSEVPADPEAIWFFRMDPRPPDAAPASP